MTHSPPRKRECVTNQRPLLARQAMRLGWEKKRGVTGTVTPRLYGNGR
jgi:hypothetical protein